MSTNNNNNLTYRQLQVILKAHKSVGDTTIALNSKKAVLVAELDRIEAAQSNALDAETIAKKKPSWKKKIWIM